MENAFGIFANRFRVFLSPISLSPDNTEEIVLASCVLHNYLRTKSPKRYTPNGCIDTEDIREGIVIEGEWHNEGGSSLISVVREGGRNYSNSAKEIRGEFCTYFNTTGSVHWQEKFAIM